ncbi:NAD(P)-binding protein [Meira miltonrushii]|uniref:NAD(P)-binding protein n=1 Tax=Meira miltonrushii TaxID=1280837 RepID=A0A316VHM5_9BASI|nr:NAD(P)-binding protein [Meira miltonrushii]PWN37046.1 NAD(P)-binding protein [Meira miltonrushii]
MLEEKVGITVIGAAGLIGKRHVEHILENKQAKLHSIVDPTPAAQSIAKEANVQQYLDLSELLQHSEGLHAAIVATPTGMHIQQACQLVRGGIHVLVEKPLCNTVEEAQPLLQACRQPGAGTVLVGFHRRFNPYILHLKSILDGEQSNLGTSPVGTIVAVNGLWCTRKPLTYFRQAPWRAERGKGGGVILTNLSHELDLMRFLFGEITRVFAEPGSTTRGFDVEETVAITLKFQSGCVGTIILSDSALTPYTFESATGENPFLAKHHQPVYTIMGTSGTINFPNMELWSFTGQSIEGGDWTLPLTQSKQAALPFDQEFATDTGPNSPFAKRLQHWLDFIQGKSETLSCTLDDGLRNMAILEAILSSASSGEAVVV